MLEVISPQADRLDWASLSVEMRVPAFPYNMSYWEGPAYFDIPPLRILTHETIHFWQILSMGFLTNLGTEIWRNLIEFEKTGKVNQFIDLQTKLEEKDHNVGFSIHDLIETHARFWDIHILGPELVATFEREQRSYDDEVKDYGQKVPKDAKVKPYYGNAFDAVMTTATYGEPYRRAIESWGSNGAAVIFPIASYFAMQSSDPLKTYIRIEGFVKRFFKIKADSSIHDSWRGFFTFFRKECNRFALEETGSFLTPGLDVFDRSQSVGIGDDQNGLYFLYGTILSHMSETYGRAILDFLFCFPGDPKCRGQLIGHVLPAQIIMFGGSWKPRPPIADSIDKLLNKKGLTYESLAAHAESINQRVRKMRLHATLDQFTKNVGGNQPAKQ